MLVEAFVVGHADQGGDLGAGIGDDDFFAGGCDLAGDRTEFGPQTFQRVYAGLICYP